MTRHFFIILALTLALFSADAQTSESKIADNKREFKNAGEQENYWAEQLFEKEYSKKFFEKFKGDILVTGNNFTYGDQTLIVVNTATELNRIFSTGLFFPSIITGNRKTIVKSKQELDTLPIAQQVFYDLTRTDSLTISDVEELNFLTKTNTVKRFRFWLFRKGSANPTVCFFELTNKKANDKTDLTSFINGATLTFFKSGWVVILNKQPLTSVCSKWD
jgi:hypothetical protein